MSKQDRAIKLLKTILTNTDLSDIYREHQAALGVMCIAVLANKEEMVDNVIRKFSFVAEFAGVTEPIDDSIGTDGEGHS
jgi:hypothetical protein